MICPKCNKEGVKYVERKDRLSRMVKQKQGGTKEVRYYKPRTDFKVKHNCGFEGEL